MFWFISAIVLALIAIAWFVIDPSRTTEGGQEFRAGRYVEIKPERTSYRKYFIIPAILAVVALLFSCFTQVGTRNVGVPTVFGKTTGDTYASGLHFKAPWVKVTDIDGTIQPEEYKGDDCIYVKIADGGTACATVAYRWRITQDGADQAYVDYRNSDKDINDAVRDAVVSTNIKASINEVFGGYDPLEGSQLSPNMTPEQLANAKVNVVPDWQQLNADIEDNVADKIKNVGGIVEIQSVTVSGLKLPEATQTRINAFNAAVQDTKIALQEVATKDAQASGNTKLAASLKDPNVLVSKCLDSLASGEFTAPAGFSCWPTGGGTVVVPSVK